MLLNVKANEPKDFDFIMGHWRVKHSRLKEILNDCEHWYEFDGLSATTKTLGGFGNVEDNLLCLPQMQVRAKAIRSYDPETLSWSIWWLDERNPGAMDQPVRGNFVNGVGTFYGQDFYQDREIDVRFIWDATDPNNPKWEQAFSADRGKSWEVNWKMSFSRQ